MPYISTLTTKGQIVIPYPIREALGLRVADKLSFEVEQDRIIAQPIISIDEALGMIKAGRYVSKKELKRAITEQTVKKFS